MRKIVLILLFGQALWGQEIASFQSVYSRVKPDYPFVPEGLTEAVAFHSSRWEWVFGEKACTGKPVAMGYLGVIAGSGHGMNANGRMLDSLSPWEEDALLNDPEIQVRAWLHSLQVLASEVQVSSPEDWLWLALMLSEIPFGEDAAVLPQAFWLQETAYWWEKFAGIHCDLGKLLPISVVEQIEGSFIQVNRYDQPGVSVVAAPTCNKGSRNGTAVSAVTVHVAQGTYAGTIAWFLNCNSSVSAHYVIRSSDGQITQMVAESERAFHVGTENPYTVGIEHEGYVSNPVWFTDTLYGSSAWLVSGICGRHGIPTGRTAWWPWTAGSIFNQTGRPGSCTRVKGHQHFPNQTHTDPGPHWDWERYYRRINPPPPPILITGQQGTFTWPASGAYANDVRAIWRVGNGNGIVQANFTYLDTELNWDYIAVYDGPDIESTFLGMYSGTANPGSFAGQSGYLTIEFRSDCAVTGLGFQMSWEVIGWNLDSLSPVSGLVSPVVPWITESFEANYADVSLGQSGLSYCGFLPVSFDGERWGANSEAGFVYDDFTGPTIQLHPQWQVVSGNWMLSEGRLIQTTVQANPAQVRMVWEPDLSSGQLLTTRIRWHGTHPERSVGMYMYGTAHDLPYFGTSLYFECKPAAQQAGLYWCSGGQRTPLALGTIALNSGVWYSVRAYFQPTEGRFRLWVGEQLVLDVQSVTIPSGCRWLGLETRHCVGEFGELAVYKERLCNGSQWVQAGVGTQSWLPNHSVNPGSKAARLFGVALGGNGRLSARHVQSYKVDYTPPTGPNALHNAAWENRDTVTGLYWPLYFTPAADVHSAILYYEVALGSDSCLQDIHAWHEVQDAPPALMELPESMTPGLRYYPSIRAVNGAGIKGPVLCGPGAVWLPSSSGISDLAKLPMLVIPNPGRNLFKLQLPTEYALTELSVIDVSGRTILPESLFFLPDGVLFRLPEGIAGGLYYLKTDIGNTLPFIVLAN